MLIGLYANYKKIDFYYRSLNQVMYGLIPLLKDL